MKRNIIIVLCIAIIVVIIFLYKDNTTKIAKLNFYNSYIVDELGMKNKLKIENTTPFTGFIQLKNYDGFNGLEKEFNMDFSMIDYDNQFDNHFIVLSFGRKVEEITYKYLKRPHKYHAIAKADVVLSEDFNEHTMYVYLMDRVLFLDAFLEGNSFYIMQGNEKKYVGNIIDDLSK